jgi:hypothetical protein
MGPTQAIYLSNTLDSALLEMIDAVLEVNCHEIARTRKGRVWTVQIGGRPFDIAAEHTVDVRWDCEDALTSRGLSIEDTPTRIVVAAGCNEPEDWQLLDTLTQRMLATLPSSFLLAPASK